MSPLKDRITDDMKAAMRGRDAPRLGAIRMLLAALKQKEVDERVELDDAMVLAIVDRLLKQRKDSITQFQAAGRADLVAAEQAEVAVLSAYLPQPLDDAQVNAAVAAAIAAVGLTGPQAIGKVMAVLKPQLAGRADMTAVAALVKRTLAG